MKLLPWRRDSQSDVENSKDVLRLHKENWIESELKQPSSVFKIIIVIFQLN